ncbi:circadian clock-controlled protein daywake-like [Epargyreus clarus]|uniref:circadian clock-controlled protein daywake-like n=1 Tax=Epargyreus clarus TaxID=520877 RepID=UPI003C2D684E
MQSLFYFLFLVPLISGALAENDYLPPYIVPCNFKDANFETCVRKQIENSLRPFTKGIEKMHVPSIDPLNLDDIVIDGNGLKLTFKKASMHGLSDSELTEFKINLGKEEQSFKLAFKGNLSLTAQYDADGQILILPIKGNGDAFILAQNIEVEMNCLLLQYNDSKGEHLKLGSPNYKYDIQSTTFDLKNLFNGNKQLAETTLQFANENWRQLMDDLAPSVVKQIVRACIKVINKFFSKLTIKQIIKDYHH